MIGIISLFIEIIQVKLIHLHILIHNVISPEQKRALKLSVT